MEEGGGGGASVHMLACCEGWVFGRSGRDKTSCNNNASLLVSLFVLSISTVLVGVIVEESNKGLLECTRVYGNLSRHAPVRAVLAKNKGNLCLASPPPPPPGLNRQC